MRHLAPASPTTTVRYAQPYLDLGRAPSGPGTTAARRLSYGVVSSVFPLHRYTYQDYVWLEEESSTRHEFLAGEIVAELVARKALATGRYARSFLNDALIAASLRETGAVLVTRNGYSIRFYETDARNMGRVAAGVRGINLREGYYQSEMKGERAREPEDVR